MCVHVAQARNTNNVVVNSLFYKGLRKIKSQKNGKNAEIFVNFAKMFAICLQKKAKCMQTKLSQLKYWLLFWLKFNGLLRKTGVL